MARKFIILAALRAALQYLAGKQFSSTFCGFAPLLQTISVLNNIQVPSPLLKIRLRVIRGPAARLLQTISALNNIQVLPRGAATKEPLINSDYR